MTKRDKELILKYIDDSIAFHAFWGHTNVQGLDVEYKQAKDNLLRLKKMILNNP